MWITIYPRVKYNDIQSWKLSFGFMITTFCEPKWYFRNKIENTMFFIIKFFAVFLLEYVCWIQWATVIKYDLYYKLEQN